MKAMTRQSLPMTWSRLHAGARTATAAEPSPPWSLLIWGAVAVLAVIAAPLAVAGAQRLALEIMVVLFHLAGWPWP